MNKKCNPSLEGPVAIAPRNDNGKRIYRAISDAARRLDKSRINATTLLDLFESECEIQRVKLRENCEKLIFSEPLLFGRKAQEMLWRKGYYEVVYTAKRLRSKDEHVLNNSLLYCHIDAGIGQYHHILSKLQEEFGIDLNGIIDFPSFDQDKKCEVHLSPEVKKWAYLAAHTCLVSLGDLCRYKVELGIHWDISVPVGYYNQAVKLEPDIGMPHNQLGTLSGSANYCLDAVYHYMRCLICPQAFEGADCNLTRIFEKNSNYLEELPVDDDVDIDCEEHIKRLIARFLLLFNIWFFNKSITDINTLCHKTLSDFRECLTYTKPIPSENIDDITDIEELLQNGRKNLNNPNHIDSDLLFKIVTICLLCIQKLQDSRSEQTPLVKAFTLAIFAELVEIAIENINDSVFNITRHSSVISGNHNENNKDESNINKMHTFVEQINESKAAGDVATNADPCIETKETEMNGFIESPTPKDDKQHVLNGQLKSKPLDDKKSKPKLRRRRRRQYDSEESDFTDSDAMSSGCENESDVSDDDISVCSSLAEHSTDHENDSDPDIIVESIEIIKNEDDDAVTILENDTTSKMTALKISSDRVRTTSSSAEETNCETKSENNMNIPRRSYQRNRKKLQPCDILEIVLDENILRSIKILCDWIKTDSDLIKTCAQSSPYFLQKLLNLINLINMDLFSKFYKTKTGQVDNSLKFDGVRFDLESLRKMNEGIPIQEDVELMKLQILETAQETLDWNYLKSSTLNYREEALLRVVKLVNFAFYLSKMKVTKIEFNRKKRIFVLKKTKLKNNKKHINKKLKPKYDNSSNSTSSFNSNPDSKSTELMSHMGQLWLRAQVRDLESQVRRKGPQFSPYVVIDALTLAQYTYIVRQLVSAKKFIVLVPTVVLCALDELKHDSSTAREAIRWLEGQLQRGNRFLRAQRPNERTALPFVKLPKKPDRDCYNFIQIIEFCHYFIDQKVGIINHDLNRSTENSTKCLVTLLTGASIMDQGGKEFSFTGLAQSAGVNVEQINVFYAKWKNSFKTKNRKSIS